MRRDSAELTATARRRLALLGRDLGTDSTEPGGTEPGEPRVLTAPGRHLERRTPPWGGLTGAHLAVVAVLLSGVLGVVAWSTLRSAPAATPVPVARTSPLANPAAPAGSAATPSAGAEGQVVVDVAGKVRRPGVATLPAGSRVIDAVRKAGGARPGVDLSGLNLARMLVDGEQVRVGAPSAAAAAAGIPAGTPPGGDLVNVNTASAEQLEELPGVGPVTAAKIIERRARAGPFTAVDELLEVDGIGEKTMAELAPHVTL